MATHQIVSSDPSTWDALAASYDAERREDAVYHRCIAYTCRTVPTADRILDVGCGTGLVTLPLCRSARRVIAADYSVNSLRTLRAKSAVPLLCAAHLCALPFQPGSFDVVLCANALQHLTPADQRIAVRELYRALKPNGYLVVTVHHYSHQKAKAGWAKEGRPGQPGVDYIFRFTRAELAALLPGAEIHAMGFQSRLDSRLPAFIRQRLAIHGRGYMLLASARG